MKERIVFSPHSLERIGERLKLSPRDIHKRLHAGVYAYAGEILDRESQVRLRHLVLWDHGLRKPAFLVLEKRDGAWTVVTTYTTMTYHRRRYGITILPTHIIIAQDLDRDFRNGKISIETDMVRLNIVVRTGKSVRRLKFAPIPYDEYRSKYGSAQSYLEHIITTDALNEVEVSHGAEVDVVLYGYVHSMTQKIELEKLCLCV